MSNPEPGGKGLTMKEAIWIIQGMRELDVIVADARFRDQLTAPQLRLTSP